MFLPLAQLDPEEPQSPLEREGPVTGMSPTQFCEGDMVHHVICPDMGDVRETQGGTGFLAGFCELARPDAVQSAYL